MKNNDSRRKIGIFGSVPVYALPLINSVNELKALVGISSYQGTNEEAFPSLEKLSKRIGLSPAATSTAVTGLVKKDLVGRKRNYGKTNTYFILYETESMQEMKLHNKEEKKKSRAKRLLDNIEIHNQKSQLSESLECSKVSNVSYSNFSNAERSKVSNDILKEHIKEQSKRTEPEIELPKIKSLSEQLQELAEKNNIPYTDDVRQDNNFHSKLMLEIKNCTNEKILERANQFIAIAKRDKKPSWVLTNKLGFKTLKFKWDDIEMEYKAGKAHNAHPRPIKVKETLYDESRAGIVPSLEELQRMYSDV